MAFFGIKREADPLCFGNPLHVVCVYCFIIPLRLQLSNQLGYHYYQSSNLTYLGL